MGLHIALNNDESAPANLCDTRHAAPGTRVEVTGLSVVLSAGTAFCDQMPPPRAAVHENHGDHRVLIMSPSKSSPSLILTQEVPAASLQFCEG